jgi:CBS domain containing-hemolysin-like protein
MLTNGTNALNHRSARKRSHSPTAVMSAVSRLRRATLRAWTLLVLSPGVANASFLAGDALDTMADWLSIFILIFVPIAGITVFWLVHILPELIAEKKHHPQKDAIKTLCLLSLVFGGLLWPLAWLWAYTKPVMHKLAYGTDKHEDYYKELAHAQAGDARELKDDVVRLRGELDVLVAKGRVPEELGAIREQLVELESRLVEPRAPVRER